MARYGHDRLTALDNSFLLLERPQATMHVSSTGTFDAAPLRTPEGGIDIELIKRGIGASLHRIPRYRQKLAWIPLLGHPVWVDDERFNLSFHVRHTSLPRPGDEEQLKRLSARIMAQRLDRARPLWEMWFVEGLEGDRFAVISKVHHCMIDGISGVDLLSVLLRPSPDAEIPESPPYVPRPAPTASELLRDELLRRAWMPFAVAQDVRKLVTEAADARREVLVRVRAVAETLGATLRPASATPFNQPIGPHRRFDWLVQDLTEIKAVRRALGGSLNDVVLAVVAGAVRRFLMERRVDPAGLDFRVAAPVSVRKPHERGKLGNRVSAWIVPLPVGEPDPRAQLAAISATTAELKEQRSAVGAEMLTQAAEWTPATLLSLGARHATRLLPFNMVVTNVPGPQIPLYLLGARMREIYPQVPVTDHLGLSVALFSYDGRLCWGFNADDVLVPDLERFTAHVAEAFQALRRSAGLPAPAAQRPGAPARMAARAPTDRTPREEGAGRSATRRSARGKASPQRAEP
jgi:diacylglycerol O-acyltransferase / wax synthase